MTNIPSREISKILKLSIESPNSKVNKQFMSDMQVLANRLVGYQSKEKGGLAYKLNEAMMEEASQGIDRVNTLLKAGIPGASSTGDPIAEVPTNWKLLSPNWIKRKRPKSRDLYWKNTGRLGLGFGNIANNYKRLLRNHEPLVTLKTRKATYGKPFKYDIRLSMPLHRSKVITRVIPEAFMNQRYLDERLETTDYTETVISLLEGKGRTERPFIAKVMAMKGASFKQRLDKNVKDALSGLDVLARLKT